MPVLLCTHTYTQTYSHTNPSHTIQAFAGIFAVTARIISSLIPSSDPTLSTLLYFSLALAVVVVCLVSFFILVQLVSCQAKLMYWTMCTVNLIIAHKKNSVVRNLFSITSWRQTSVLKVIQIVQVMKPKPPKHILYPRMLKLHV